jgi:hypothetical protein
MLVTQGSALRRSTMAGLRRPYRTSRPVLAGTRDRVLGIDAVLDRPAVELHILLRERQLLARRDPDHLLDQVEPRHFLGHGCSTWSRVFISRK